MLEKNSIRRTDKSTFNEIYHQIIAETENIKILARIIEILSTITKMDQSFISLVNDNLKSIIVVKYHNLENFDTDNQFPEDLDLQIYPWFYQQLKKNIVICLDLNNEKKVTSTSIEELLLLKSIKYFYAVPLYFMNELIGFLGFTAKNSVGEEFDRWIREIKIIGLTISSILINDNLLKAIEILEKKLETFTKFSDNIIISLNKNKIIENVNEKPLNKYLGYNSEDLKGFSILSFLHHEDYNSLEDQIQQSSDLEDNSLEIRFKTKQGNWQQFDCRIFELSTGFFNTLILVLTNIEQRKWIELKYKNLFDNSPNAILIIDFKGIIVDVNKSTQKVFGFKRNFFLGKNLDELDKIFPIELKYYYKETFQAFFKKKFPEPIEIEVVSNSGSKIWLEVQASVIKHETNILIQLLFQNITEKKQRELLELEFKEQLEREVEARTIDLNYAFQQQQKYLDQILKSSQFKTEFMSSMSHELRTPLNAIIGFTELLLEEVYGPLTEEQRDFIQDIKISAEDQFHMIKNILNISNIESGQILLNIKRFSLNSMVEQIISSLKPLVGNKKIQFKVTGLEDDKAMEADPIRLKEILLNILSNAVKFTIDGTITLRVFEKFDKWEFEVSDPGIGIAIKDFPIIFKDFQRVDSTYVRSVPGTGLGLSLTKRLVELHGGEIKFFSVLGVGTTFCFSIMKNQIVK